jgi:hypothetical protein
MRASCSSSNGFGKTALLLQHIKSSATNGAGFDELQEVLPALSRDQIQTLMRELKEAGVVKPRGNTRAARWYPADGSLT